MLPLRLTAKLFLGAVALTASLSLPTSRADGDPAPTYQRERAAQKFKDCHWTDEMGKYVYQCIKKNDGMNAHWCYDETLEVLCPAQLEAAKKSAVQTDPVAKPGNN
jgi:hypothetical protein